MKKVAVIGIGNILLRDDGVGIHLVRQLEEEHPSNDVEFVDGGTSTIDMIGYFTCCSKVIIIDALKAGMEPGTIFKIKPGDIKSYKKENLSLHDVQILDVIKMAETMGAKPQVEIYGIEPQDVSMGLELSGLIKEKLPALAALVKASISPV